MNKAPVSVAEGPQSSGLAAPLDSIVRQHLEGGDKPLIAWICGRF